MTSQKDSGIPLLRRHHSRNILVILGLLSALTGLASLGLDRAPPAPRAAISRANADDPAQIGAGRDLFAAQCAACHGKDLQGEFAWRIPSADGRIKAPPLGPMGHTYEHSDDALKAMVADGAGVSEFMPRFAGRLSEAEIWAVLAYIKSTWPLALRIAQAGANPDKAGMPAEVLSPERVQPETCVNTKRSAGR
jgi:mono/diheme cytochrome c family protein